MKQSRRYSPEVRQRAVRMVFEHQGDYASQWAAIGSIAGKFGCTPETLRSWVRQAERDRGLRDGQTTEERERVKALEHENRELKRANEILRKASAYFAPIGPRPPRQVMIDFIDHHRDVYGVEPICSVLPIAPSTYHEAKRQASEPSRRSARQKRDAEIRGAIQQTWNANKCVYGARKVWRQLQRDQWHVARCTVKRLMRDMGLHGVTRGRAPRTTQSDACQAAPEDHVRRDFTAHAPNQLWVADFTYVATWRGFVYVAFVIDAFASRIVGWRASNAPNTNLVLDALEQAIHDRQPAKGLIQHTDRGVQYLSIRYSDRLADLGITPSVGRVGSSYDKALAETVIGLFKTEVIRRNGPWRDLEAVEFATLDWVDWFNRQRLLGPLGDIPPSEAEEHFYATLSESAKAA
ncbi:IS3 family transposase [Salinisphaera sp. Q1T1-3]|uniref:IS3 family transposase n=1 Tax=Salinisphaera sp. Q1T1-3 TaxID=2321229 RepID=UPI000E761374|nr:IS3 family transposase [Salinisphaera sp. Q1T1-3]RJS91687.1 IS3 family transposase [Salinisphaera sp. Q1T1-3]